MLWFAVGTIGRRQWFDYAHQPEAEEARERFGEGSIQAREQGAREQGRETSPFPPAPCPNSSFSPLPSAPRPPASFSPSSPLLPTPLKLAACALLLVTTACSPGKTESAQSVDSNRTSSVSSVATPNQTSTLRIGYVGSAEPTGPLGWAKKTGLLDRELQKLGFRDVTFARFANGPNLNESLVAGQVDVGFLGDTPAIVLRARGVETKLLRISQFNTTAWLVTKKNGARSVADLKGQIVATQKGSYMHRYLLGLLDQQGLSKDVKVVHLLSTEAKPALERGDIAAYAASSDLGVFLKSQGFPVIDSSGDHPGLSGTSLVVATEKFLAQQPDFPQKLNALLTEATKDLKANSQEYYQYHAQVARYPVEIIKASFPLKQVSEEPFPAEGVKLVEGTKKFLVSQNLAKSDFQLADWIVKK